MTLLRVPLTLSRCGCVDLDEAASRYVSRVHRLGVSDCFLAFDPESALEAEATILEVGKKGVRCSIDALRKARLVASRPLWLLQGLGKGDKLDSVVRDATELGATSVVALCSARSVVKLADASARTLRWKRIAVEAARQCGRGDCPVVHPPTALEEALRALPHDALKLCLWECATAPLRPLLVSLVPERPVCVMIGPEGGLSDEEVQLAVDAGFIPVSIGPFILRTETAATAVLGAILSMSG